VRPLSHLGEYPGTRRRNSWHDALVCLTFAAYANAADERDTLTDGGAALPTISITVADGSGGSRPLAVGGPPLPESLASMLSSASSSSSSAAQQQQDAQQPLVAPVVGMGEVSRLMRSMLSDYRVASTGLLRHQLGMAELPPAEQVQFTCTQAIWAAVGRAAEAALAIDTEDEQGEGPSGARATLCGEVSAHRDAWRAYCAENADSDGLLPVANVYRDVRLWCNTEPAAFLLLERDDFAPLRPQPAAGWRVF
jgi:hypothetical protein